MRSANSFYIFTILSSKFYTLLGSGYENVVPAHNKPQIYILFHYITAATIYLRAQRLQFLLIITTSTLPCYSLYSCGVIALRRFRGLLLLWNGGCAGTINIGIYYLLVNFELKSKSQCWIWVILNDGESISPHTG